MRQTLFTIAFLCISTIFYAQEDTVVKVHIPTEQKYEFTTVIDIEASAVKSQGNTGTCWSFSTSSFLESEIFRSSGKMIDISEMYNVRNAYMDKSWNYVMRQGKIQFSEGGLAHDVMNSVQKNGLQPEIAYSGLLGNAKIHNHAKIVPDLKEVLDAYIKNDKNSKHSNWKVAVDSILTVHLGTPSATFLYEGIEYNAMSFLKMTNIKPNNYITLTSFLHQPFHTEFVLNIPDNFSNGSFYNIPLNELVDGVDIALDKGYTLALDCDVSEKTFSSKYGVAILPNNPNETEKSLTYIVTEKDVTPEFRQEEFENFNTTDDHLMHIVGLVKDQNGTEYYKVKNSWGTNSNRIGNNGYVYMSKAFFKLKTISVMVHKDAVSDLIEL
ncbi:bleomycin hydrolase [Lutibacter agarilyticus]|uniref:Aminopeptidase n=1 Tax=Lutibacter agarilyticus TaxID=1109740 RepID=A0A238XJR5_9FLAO|nr:C1 family peptidase [Lutibacter agarilyticus]SNR58713.1 bleomycin hydrolase [Lutibacter agarilyticus]